MAKIVVTSGKRFVDIDGLASLIAYTEIPPEKAIAVVAGPLNNSITPTIKKWPLNYATSVQGEDLEFVIVDVSEFQEFPNFVKKEKIIEIYDHHFGFEKNWEYLGEKSVIAEVGACATLIWEEFKKRNPNKKISPLSANLLYTAIASNTLNFHLPLTNERDRRAFQELKPFIDLPNGWIAKYYQDIELDVYLNPKEAIVGDTKIQMIKGQECAFGQLELWNSKPFILEHSEEIEAALKDFSAELWLFSSPSISEGRNYLYTKSETLKNYLRGVLDITFEGNIGTTTKLWLRKEILKLIQ